MSAGSSKSAGLAQRYLAAIQNNSDNKIHSDGVDTVNAKPKRPRNHSEPIQKAAHLLPIPNDAHLEEEAMQSRNGSTSPSRLRSCRFPLNNTRDSVSDMNEIDDTLVLNNDCNESESPTSETEHTSELSSIRKWTQPQWQNCRSRQNNAENEGGTQKSDLQRGRRIDTASPVLTDVSDSTEIINNRSIALSLSSSIGYKNNKGADQYVKAGKSVDANPQNIPPKSWQRKKEKAIDDQGWIKSSASRSSATRTHTTKEASVYPKIKSSASRISATRTHTTKEALVAPKMKRHSLTTRVKNPSAFSTIANQDPGENDTVEAPSVPQHKNLSSHKEPSLRPTVKSSSGTSANVHVFEQPKQVWGNFQLRSAANRVSKHIQSKLEDGQENNVERGNIGHSHARKLQPSLSEIAGTTKMLIEEDQDDTTCTNTCTISTNEQGVPNGRLNANEPSDRRENDSEFVSVKSRLRSWNQSGRNYQYVRSSSSASPVRNKISPSASSESGVRCERKQEVLAVDNNGEQDAGMNPIISKAQFRRSLTSVSSQEIATESDVASPKVNSLNDKHTHNNDVFAVRKISQMERNNEPKKSLQDRIKTFGGTQAFKQLGNRTSSKGERFFPLSSGVNATDSGRASPSSVYSKTKLLKSVSADSGRSSPHSGYIKAKLKPWKSGPKKNTPVTVDGKASRSELDSPTADNRLPEDSSDVIHRNEVGVSPVSLPGRASVQSRVTRSQQNHVEIIKNVNNDDDVDQPHTSSAVKGIRARFESAAASKSISLNLRKTTLSKSPIGGLKTNSESIQREDKDWRRRSKSVSALPHADEAKKEKNGVKPSFTDPSVPGTGQSSSKSSEGKEDEAILGPKEKINTASSGIRGKTISQRSSDISNDKCFSSVSAKSSTLEDKNEMQETRSMPIDIKAPSRSGGFQSLRSKFRGISRGNEHYPEIEEISTKCVSVFEDSERQGEQKAAVKQFDRNHEIKPSMVSAQQPKESNLEIGSLQNSAFDRIRNGFESGQKHSKSPSPTNTSRLIQSPRPDDAPIDFADNPSQMLSSSRQSQAQYKNNAPLRDNQRISAFSSYKSGSATITSVQPGDSRIEASREGSNIQSNDIPWKVTEPNDIPWTDRELLEERERSFFSQNAVNMSYSAEFLDYAYEDDDCDGVTLSPSASDVSSLSIPFGLQSVGGSSAVSDSSETSDEAIESVSASEKQSTTVGPSEASSSQISEAATPLFQSMNLRFGTCMATSSDTTGTMSYGNHFNKLLETLPPPLDVEEKDEDSDESTYKPGKNDDYGPNRQFEEQLNISREPQWKSDFFAVDSVKSNPTVGSGEAAGWAAAFHNEPSSENPNTEDNGIATKVPIKRANLSDSIGPQNPAPIKTKLSNFPIQERSVQDMSIGRKSTSVSTSSSLSPSASFPEKVKSIPSASETQNPNVKPSMLRPAVAYRRFNLQKVRAFQKARSFRRSG